MNNRNGSPYRILYVFNDVMQYGGTESFMMNYVSHFDHGLLTVDFVETGDGVGVFDEKIKEYGGAVTYVPKRGNDPIGNAKRLKEAIAAGGYSLVHAHMDAASYYALRAAKSARVPIRIAHSHNTDFQDRRPARTMLARHSKAKLPKVATDLFACSAMAGDFLFGAGAKYTIIRNAIDVKKYSFSIGTRAAVRDELGLPSDALVLGDVARLTYQKNQAFLLQVIERLRKEDARYRLVLLGDGEDHASLKQAVRQKRLEGCVTLVPARQDAYRFYSAFDCFVLPSRFEGLCISAIEAQSSGLPCIFSDRVSPETTVSSDTTRISIDNTNVEDWANAAAAACRRGRNLRAPNEVADAGYSIEKEAKKLQDWYLMRLHEVSSAVEAC